MSLDSLDKTVFQTSLGPVPLWSQSRAPEPRRPVVITITGAFADRDHMSRMQQVLGSEADAVLMHLPGSVSPTLREISVAAFAAALGEIVARDFSDRVVILNGIGVGALVALGVRAPPVRHVVAVEPPLATDKLWPMIGSLRARLRDRPQDAAFIREVFGVTQDAVAARDYLPLLDGGTTPIDVLVGDTPLMPPRALERYPSLVDEPEREILRRRHGVTVHVVADAGNNLPLQAPYVLRDVLLAACRTADSAVAAQALVLRTPLTAARVLYAGEGAPAFAAAYAARNPKAATIAVDDLGEAPAGRFDALATPELAPDRAMAAGGLLADGGWLILGLRASPGGTGRDVVAAFEAAGFEALGAHPAAAESGHFDDVASDRLAQLREGAATPALVLALRKRGAAPAAQRLAVHLAVFAPTLMDIRTRLPAQAMRSAPEVSAIYSGPGVTLAQLPRDMPKVLILQRPAMIDVESWRRVLAHSILNDWVVVLEYDDHPELVAQVKGRVLTEEAWARYGYPHALQTSTPQLGELFGRYNPEVKVFGNAAFEIAPFPDRPAPRRVFYGAVWRGDFAVRVVRTLGPAAEAFPEVEFVVVGDRAVFDALPAARKVFHDYVPYERYLELMSDSAVSLSPIEGRLHQDTKSDAKFLDAASRGVVTLASPTIYADTIRHGINGLIAERVEDWAPLLADALRDEPRRLQMAQAAWTYVRDERMFASQLPGRLAWYRDLWARREALTAGVMARLPGLAEALGRT